MSTNEVLQLCLVIIGICNLFIQAKKKSNRRSLAKIGDYFNGHIGG